jgi:SAM-dependent methyltransferase
LKLYITTMEMSEQLGRRIVSQFMHPRGLPRRLVGWEMALRPSNRKRNAWAVSLMDVQRSDRVLEIGFGPGIAICEIARRATRGQVVGIDRSAVMHAQAARRNAAAIREGRVSLTVASIDDPPAFDRPFDKILAVNNIGMWSEPTLRLKELAGLLRGGGLIAIVSQPRCPGATAKTTAAAASQIVEALQTAGLVATRVETLELKPPVACVIGTAPSAAERSPIREDRPDAA